MVKVVKIPFWQMDIFILFAQSINRLLMDCAFCVGRAALANFLLFFFFLEPL